jgi:chromosomal replication initiation ATPase DnaA
MYLGRHNTRASLREIADGLGVRDISTVTHREKRVAKACGKAVVGERVEAGPWIGLVHLF